MDGRETVLDDLHSAADPLVATCAPEVAAGIETAVSDVVAAWSSSANDLAALCARYQDAVNLWSQYRDATAAMQQWVDCMPRMANSEQIKVTFY